jgi:hypothetical protein
MTQEYEEIREALIALLCVGDKIMYIHCGAFVKVGYHIIKICEDGVILKELNQIKLLWREFEHYKGVLHAWDVSPLVCPYRTDKRINEMIRLLEDPSILIIARDRKIKSK